MTKIIKIKIITIKQNNFQKQTKVSKNKKSLF